MTRLRKSLGIGAVCLLSLAATGTASADSRGGFYTTLGGSVGFASDSTNTGALTGPFTTGAGTTIPAGTVLPAGADLGWTTEFDTGWGALGAIGYAFGGGFRAEAEVAYRSNGIKTHDGVTVAGINIDNQDAGVLITGSPQLGATVGQIVDDGEGRISSLSVMGNLFYDFGLGNSRFMPYVGAGAGMARVDTVYRPSGIGVVDDSNWEFAFQLMAGVSYAVSDNVQLYAGYRYLHADSPRNQVDLLPAVLQTDYQVHSVEAGVRFFLN